MNGAHDMGGMHGFGPMRLEPHEELFHAPWERRVFGLTLAMGAAGCWTIDRGRWVREAIPPAEYLSMSYYEIWLRALEGLLVAEGLVSAEELHSGRSSAPPAPVPRVLRAEAVADHLHRGNPCDRPAEAEPRFGRGDIVKTRTINPSTHTRLPRYARGRLGRITRVAGCFVFPDSNAHGLGEQPQWLYTVCFEAKDLWGPEADAALTVCLDAWDSYLESA
jgi:nitrile hydratase